MKKRKLILILFATFFLLLFACKVEDTAASDGTSDTGTTPPKTWTLTLDANGGGGLKQTSYTVTDGNTQTLTETPKKTNYSFASWNTKADGTGTEFKSGVTQVTSNLTIYAIWNADHPLLTFKALSGDITKTINNGESFNIAIDTDVPLFEYRRITDPTNMLQKSSWQDQFGKPYSATQRIVQDLTYTEVWHDSSLDEISNDLVGKWLKTNKESLYVFSKLASSTSGHIGYYYCGKDAKNGKIGDITSLTQTEVLALTLGGSNCSNTVQDRIIDLDIDTNLDSVTKQLRLITWEADFFAYISDKKIYLVYDNGVYANRIQ